MPVQMQKQDSLVYFHAQTAILISARAHSAGLRNPRSNCAEASQQLSLQMGPSKHFSEKTLNKAIEGKAMIRKIPNLSDVLEMTR